METRGGPWRWRCERRVAGSAACPPVTREFSTPGCKLQYPQVISAGVSMDSRRGTGELDIPIRGFRAIPFRTRNRSVRVRLSRMRCPAPTRGVQPPRAGPSSRRDAGGGGQRYLATRTLQSCQLRRPRQLLQSSSAPAAICSTVVCAHLRCFPLVSLGGCAVAGPM